MVDGVAVEPSGREGNSLRGRAVAIDSSNVLVRSEEQLVTVIGLDSVIVIATGDAVLVADQGHSDKVKELVERLKAESPSGGDPAPADVPTVGLLPEHRPGRSLPGQAHRGAAGRTSVAAEALSPRGTLGRGQRGGEVKLNGAVQLVHENESIYLPIGCNHRLVNPGKIDLELIEVRTGSYLGEDDIVRIEDATTGCERGTRCVGLRRLTT